MPSACRQLPSPAARPLWALRQTAASPCSMWLSRAEQHWPGWPGCGPALVRHPSHGYLTVPRAHRDYLSTLGDLTCCCRHGVARVPSQMPSSSAQCWGCASPTLVLLARLRLQGLAAVPYSPISNPQGVDPVAQDLECQKWGVALCSSCALQSWCPDAPGTAPGVPHIHSPQCALSSCTPWPSGNQEGQPQSPICLHSPAFQQHPAWHSHFTGP